MPLSFAAQGYFFAKKWSATIMIGNQYFFKIQRIWGSYSFASEFNALANRSSSIRQ